MADKLISYRVDDVNGTSAASVRYVFSINDQHYEIDLSEENRLAFDKDLGRWAGHGRRVKSRRESSRAPNNAEKIRKWAQKNGYSVADRGRIPAHIRQAYDNRRVSPQKG